uniref:NADH-ubiquinone oxidoreductase chain 4L n=1 Tax=Solenostomus cyanopterus TaxID=270527 RepID=A7BHR9_9TELE|nr:NADH dehydrogenase subunit 4L [Solenostomus cyanopterus]BAF74894.1 NADH dehydrogenase subunit 4L [Solenostomus cyanopterus]BBU25691.1 NADH dehydrogenase subunit 4L [Solenostomus cyanopterus]
MNLTQMVMSTAFLVSLMGLTFHRTYLLSALLCLEAIMLALFIALTLWSLQTTSTNFSPAPLLLLAFSACEAGAGLALLVASARTHGNTQLKSLSLLQC